MPSERKAAQAATEANSKLIAPPKQPKQDKPAGGKPRAPRAPPAHPPYAAMITEAIEAEGDKRSGASRPAIKKYLLKTFNLKDTNAFDSNVAAAIRRGYDSGSFDLPKGLGGKVKIGTGERSDTSESEDDKPARSASRKTVAGAKKPASTSRSRSSAAKPALKKAAAPAAKRTSATSKAAARPEPKPVGRTTNAAKRAAAKTQVDRKPVVPKRGSVGPRKSASRSTAKKTASPRRRSSRA
ncbi:hypothetical protein JCM3770_001871 [Rhodotorula araucariae]